MFGDFGHGILMFLCGLYLVLREKNLEARQIRDEVWNHDLVRDGVEIEFSYFVVFVFF